MNCPDGHGPMEQGLGFRVCLRCGRQIDDRLADLPTVVALPLQEYQAESHPVMRVHRFCDAVELLVRFLVVVGLGEARKLGRLPPDLLDKELKPRVERPTFGQWRGMLKALASYLKGRQLVFPAFADFCERVLLPALPGGAAAPETCVISLRNLLVHGGAMSTTRAGELLEIWAPWLELLVDALEWFGQSVLCAAGEPVRQLRGPYVKGESIERPPPIQGVDLDGHLVLVGESGWLDLWPLCDYGRGTATTLSGRREAPSESPLLYSRAAPDRLYYAALGIDLPRAENREALQEFQQLFALEPIEPWRRALVPDFAEELATDSAALVGRVSELKALHRLLRDQHSGVIWVHGPGGIGKSYLMARLATDLSQQESPWHVAWRFRTQDRGRCHRSAFLRHAVERLSALVHQNIVPGDDAGDLQDQLLDLLRACGQRVIFLVDGLDEIERLDQDFPRLPFDLCPEGVVWVCVGRPERTLPGVFTTSRCAALYELPAMSDADIRAMLLDGSGCLKYRLLELDEETGSQAVFNPFVQAVAERAAGLPLYVRLVVEEVVSDRQSLTNLQRRLPASLSDYYNELLARQLIGEVQAMLTPLLVTLSWSSDPVDVDTLHLLMVRRKVVLDDDTGRAALDRALKALQSLLRVGPTPWDGVGYEPYHGKLRQHLREDTRGVLGDQNHLARDELCRLTTEWAEIPAGHPALRYALQSGAKNLRLAGRWKDLVGLLCDEGYLEARHGLDTADRIRQEFVAVREAMPESPERARLEDFLRFHPQLLATES